MVTQFTVYLFNKDVDRSVHVGLSWCENESDTATVFDVELFEIDDTGKPTSVAFPVRWVDAGGHLEVVDPVCRVWEKSDRLCGIIVGLKGVLRAKNRELRFGSDGGDGVCRWSRQTCTHL